MTELDQRARERRTVEETVLSDYLKFHLHEPEGWTPEAMRRIVETMLDKSRTPSQPWKQADKQLEKSVKNERQRERRKGAAWNYVILYEEYNNSNFTYPISN